MGLVAFYICAQSDCVMLHGHIISVRVATDGELAAPCADRSSRVCAESCASFLLSLSRLVSARVMMQIDFIYDKQETACKDVGDRYMVRSYVYCATTRVLAIRQVSSSLMCHYDNTTKSTLKPCLSGMGASSRWSGTSRKPLKKRTSRTTSRRHDRARIYARKRRA